MRKWNKTSSLLFLAAASVYPVGAILAAPGDKAEPAKTATPAADVRLLDEVAPASLNTEKDAVPASQPAVPASQPSTDPVNTKAGEGTSATSAQVNISDAGTVEIHVNEANLVEVLRMLSMQSQKNIIASKDVRGTVTANLYNVTIREALDAILKANGYGYREKGNFVYVYTAKELAEIEKAERRTTTEVIRLYYTPAKDAAPMLKTVLSTDAAVSFTAAPGTGVAAGNADAGGNAHAENDIIVVRDYPENIEAAKRVIRELDRRPAQILVEATIIAARLTEDNALGVDFNILGGVDFAELIHSDGQIKNANLPAGDGAITDNRVHSVGTGNQFTQTIQKGFRVGFVSSNVSVFVAALEEVADTSVLANPKVLTLNKQRGEVLVGREDGYLTTTVTDTTAVQTVEFLKTGTRLIFRPYVGDDGYVRMEVHPEDSDGTVVNGLPQKTTTEVTTNVMVKDGHTVVIGGLFRESSATSRTQIPGLGNVPLLGALFRNQTDNTIREEIIIMLTPHIIKDDAAYSRVSEETKRDMEKLRVGVRKGMMFWGRERLAECAYENAVDEMAESNPNRKRALWHLDNAINLNPKFSEAIKMKEELSGKELSTVDNSSVRDFIRRRILAERRAAAAAELIEQPAWDPSAFLAPAPTAPSSQPSTQPSDATAETPWQDPTWSDVPASQPSTQPSEVVTGPSTQPATQPSDATVTSPTEPELPPEFEFEPEFEPEPLPESEPLPEPLPGQDD